MKNLSRISLLRFALMSIMGLSCSALLAAPQGPPTVDVNVVTNQTTAEWRFKALSITETDGSAFDGEPGQGHRVLHRICANEVQNSRACLSSEVVKSTLPDRDKDAWVIPTNISVLYTPGEASKWLVLDEVSGVEFDGISGELLSLSDHINNMSCRAFTQASDEGDLVFGMVLSSFDQLGLSVCETARPVACCAPVTVTTEPE